MRADQAHVKPHAIRLAKPYFDDREAEAVRGVIDSGWLIQGPRVDQFEEKLSRYCGSRHCIAVTSGTAALHLSLMALGIREGDCVLVSSFAWPSAANVTRLMGARPIFVDSSLSTYNLGTDNLRASITRLGKSGCRPSALIPVHQFGHPCDIEVVQEVADEFNIPVLEDSACALGSFISGRHVGTNGRLGVLSFHPRKVITTGEGGAIITDDDSLAETCRSLRNHGSLEIPGFNYRMSDIHAAIGVVQMDKLDEILRKRQALVGVYLEMLQHDRGYTLPSYLSWTETTPHLKTSVQTLMLTLDSDLDRDAIVSRMGESDIEAGMGSVAAHLLPAFSGDSDEEDPCPVATVLHRQGLALPLHPGMSDDDVARTVEVLHDAVNRVRR
ncbi:MAG: DegT/DnrJ/EryC1/StrS aminotransferase family protein [Candidatus Zixiibacteriota bacterium]|nr:MAG: DegT/DnrJ/EryC1/StrS aminotransferase family protein [candidate division Zixibacteria bacterium]